MSHEDPFYLVKDEVQRTIDEIGGIFSRWQELLDHTNTAENDEFEFITRELNTHLGSIDEDLRALEESVSMVELHREKFGVEEDDLRQRKKFVTDVRKRVREIRQKIDAPSTQAKIDRDQKEVLLSGNSHLAPHLHDARNLRGDLLIGQEREDQRLLMQQQDEVLDEIHEGAVNLHEVSVEMNKELKKQVGMLEDVNQSTSDLSTRLKAANNKVTDLIEHSLSVKQKMCVMVFLTIVFVILTFLVFYT